MAKRTLIGHANHLYKDGDYTSLEVETFEPDPEEQLEDWICIRDGEHFIYVSSLEQWQQLDAIVRKGLDGLS